MDSEFQSSFSSGAKFVFIRVHWWCPPAWVLLAYGSGENNGSRLRLIGKAVLIPIRIEAEVLEHLKILFHGLVQCGEIISDHERAGASHKDHALQVAQIHGAPTRDHDFLPRQDETKTGNRFQNFEGRQRRLLFEGRSFNWIEDIDRHDVSAEVLEREGQVATVFASLAHPKNSAGTDFD